MSKIKRLELSLRVFNEEVGFYDFTNDTYLHLGELYKVLADSGIDVDKVGITFNVKGDSQAVAVLMAKEVEDVE